jgi:DNA replication protein DnaC
MVNEETYRQLIDMKLFGLAHAFKEHLEQPARSDDLTFEERFGMMVDREWTERQTRRLKLRLAKSRLREPACVEDIDYHHPRGLDRSVMQRLIACQWVREHEDLIITGTSGLGKTWLSCALLQKICRDGHTALYSRVPRLLEELYVARGSGTYAKVIDRLARPDVLALDDFGLAPLSDSERRDLLEVIEERHGRRSTIVASQLEVKHWHGLIGEPTIADAILDRLITGAHRVELKGKTTMRGKTRSARTHEPSESPPVDGGSPATGHRGAP